MPFTPPFSDNPGDHDLFYGLAVPRNQLMLKLGASDKSEHGHKINYYDVGDVAKGAKLPPMNDEFKTWLGGHTKYKHAVDVDKYLWPHWRLKSKGGLEWATTVKRINVHFCLDGMMSDTHFTIPLKLYGDEDNFKTSDYAFGKPGWKKKERAITNAELRWVYRHRFVKEVQEHIQFWHEEKPCGPPWEEKALKAFWDQYIPKVVPNKPTT